MIEIDGATGEGGGQILRSALSLSLCTQRPVRLFNIRAGRPRPGLMRQHLACVEAALAVSGGRAVGADLGSVELRFEPGPVRAGDHEFRIATAGSCALVLQTVLPPLMLAAGPSRIVLGGGTHNPMAPSYHFLARCLAPLLARLGVGLGLELRRLGFYPAGGGEFIATITPAAEGLRPFDLVSRGALREAWAECLAPGLPPRVEQRERQALIRQLGWDASRFRALPVRADEGPGNALMVTLQYDEVCELVTGFGEKGVRSEWVARKVVRGVRHYQASVGALGPHLADQWLLPLALAVVSAQESAQGSAQGAAQRAVPGATQASFTCTEITGHIRSNLDVIEAFLPVRFETVQLDSGAAGITVQACPRQRA